MEHEIINNTENDQFEVVIDSYKAELVYRLRGNQLYLLHTYVPEELSGKGVAKALAEHALKYVLKNNYEPIVYCPYVKAYIARHPNWEKDLAEND